MGHRAGQLGTLPRTGGAWLLSALVGEGLPTQLAQGHVPPAVCVCAAANDETNKLTIEELRDFIYKIPDEEDE